jgi:UDP-glucose 4-epimerase
VKEYNKVLITGGAGYIGTHALVELSKEGYDFIVYDNLRNSNISAIKNVEKIIKKKIIFIEGDLLDENKLESVFSNYNIDSVIHFAGLKAVGESTEHPLLYYKNNVVGTINLLDVMKKYNCKKIIFSSSATVYNENIINKDYKPLTETSPIGNTTNPYGSTKYMIENILKDLVSSDETFKIVILRYFNPVGAHESGLIGDNPLGTPNNLMPYISQVATKKRDILNVYGNDYNTNDGTGVRDYIHVTDLAIAHVKSLDYINGIHNVSTKPFIFNIGTGKGTSVLDMIKTYERVNNIEIPYKIVSRRKGDIAMCYADCSLAEQELNWKANKTIEEMCIDDFRWQQSNI